MLSCSMKKLPSVREDEINSKANELVTTHR